MYPLPSTSPLKRSSRAGALSLLITLLILASQTACGPTLEELNTIKYTPLERDDWLISTPTEQQLDPLLVAELYFHAAELDNIRGLLVVKNGFLIAEDYFNGWSVDKQSNLQSVTKSYTSALTGIALQQGHLSSVDQKMMDFFPELSDQITDPRKNQITIRHLLQMRAGYPWEESTDELMHVLLEEGFRPSHLVSIPLVRDPGTGMEYSNLTSHLLGVILARATETDLKSYAQEHLFSYLGAEPEDWLLSWENYYMGFFRSAPPGPGLGPLRSTLPG
jgi:CubicO group peptidase (beta-lactamase class C family)